MRTLLVAIAFASTVFGQCSCTLGYTGCDAISGGGTPDLATMMSGTCGSDAAIQAYVAANKLPKPSAGVWGGNIPGTGSWLSTGVATFGPKINTYMDDLSCYGSSPPFNCANVQQQVFNYDNLAFTADPNYATYANSFASPIVVSSDCTGGVTLALNASPPGGSGPNCNALHYYDLAHTHAAASGVTIQAGSYPGSGEMTACSLTIGTATIAQFTACLDPMIWARHKRYANGEADAVYQEPNAAMTAYGFTASQVATFVSGTCTGVKTADPGAKCGAAANGISGDAAYITAWKGSIDYQYWDVFANSCTTTGNIYWLHLQDIQANYLTLTSLPNYILQMAIPWWCPSAGSASETNSYQGDLWCLWGSSCPGESYAASGLQNQLQDDTCKWAAIAGFHNCMQYSTLPWLCQTTSQTANHSTTGTASGTCMANLAPYPEINNWAALGTWQFGVTIQNVLVSGVVLSGR